MVGEGNLKIEGRGCSFGVGGVGWGAEERKELTIKMALYAQMDLSVLSFSSSAGCTFDILLLIKPKLQRDTENRELSTPPPPPLLTPHPPNLAVVFFFPPGEKESSINADDPAKQAQNTQTHRKKKEKKTTTGEGEKG